jgi:hypothetical protein
MQELRGVAAGTLTRLLRACLGVVCGAALLALASCASVPQRTPSEWLGVLPSDATLYASLSVTGSAPLIKKALKDAGPGFEDIGTLIDRTTRLVCSVTLAKGASPLFSAVALGSYPSGIIGARLSGNKEWSRKKAPAGSFWEWSKAGIQMGIPNNAILLASNGAVEALLSRWNAPLSLSVPPDVASDMQKTDLVLYMPELPGGLTESAAQKGVHIPIQEVWLDAAKATGAYIVRGTANTSSEREAKLLTLALKLGLVAWMRTNEVPNVAERLKTVTVSASGNQVKLAGLQFSEEEIIPMFLSLVKSLSPAEQPQSEAEPDQ